MSLLELLPDTDDFPAGLYLVATPIGNLADVTLRALRILRDAEVIYCEDTRHSGNFCRHFGIETPRVSYHQHNEASREEELLRRLEQGERVALVSDAGTPGINDPGVRAVAAAREAGYPVFGIPGACAALLAVSISGWDAENFRFRGYAPPKSGRRDRQLQEIAQEPRVQVLYETPHRIVKWLTAAGPVLGNRVLLAMKELTKRHETHYRGSAEEILQALEQRSIKGEWVIVIGPADE